MWALRPALWRWGVLSHAIASLVTLSYKCKHPTQVFLHVYTHSYSRDHRLPQCFKHMANLLSSPQTPTDVHTQALPNGQGQTRVFAQQHLRKVHISVPFLLRRCTETAPTPANGISHPLYPCIPGIYQDCSQTGIQREKFLSKPQSFTRRAQLQCESWWGMCIIYTCVHTHMHAPSNIQKITQPSPLK